MKRGMLQIYYGEGQGKTSAALGNAIRYASAGKTVCIVQFMKGQLSTSYLSRLEPEIKIFRFERSPEGFDTLTDEEKQEEKINIANGLNFAKKVLTTGECDLLVLDEVLGLVEEGMATEDEIINVLKARDLYTDVTLTGRGALPGVSRWRTPSTIWCRRRYHPPDEDVQGHESNVLTTNRHNVILKK